MTRAEFIDLCEEVSTDVSNEDWNSDATLSRIRGEIGTQSLDTEQ